MSGFLSLRRDPAAVAMVQTAFCVATLIGLLLFAGCAAAGQWM
jgi:hypothetical protein